MGAQDKQAKRNIIIAILSVAAVVAVLYVIWSYVMKSSDNNAPPSKVSTNASSSEQKKQQDEYYTQLLDTYNTKESEKARREGTSFLSTPNQGEEKSVEPEKEQQKDEPASQQAQYYPPPQQTTQQQTDREVDPDLKKHIQGMLTAWSASDASSGLAQVTEWEKAQPRSTSQASSKAGNEAANTQNGAMKKAVTIIVPAFYRTPATLKTEIDTDENSLVTATINTGPYAGAKVYATGYRRLENTVDMTFTAMKWRGNSFQINAKPVDINTSRTALSGDVNHHYFSRIIVPAIARGIGNAGDLYKESSQTQVVTPLGGTVTSRGSVDSDEVLGTVVGGAANQTADVLEQDASRIPIKTVRVPLNQTIGIQFIDAVTSDDLLNPGASNMDMEAISKPAEQPEQRRQTFTPNNGFSGGYQNYNNQGGFQ